MKLRILGKVWTVKQARPVLGDDSGESDFDRCLIVHTVNECEQQRRDTLLHEIIHAVSDSIKLKLKEKQVHALACALLAVLRDNPELVEYLLKEDE